MKKTILSITICLLSFTLRVNGQQSPNPIVYRLSSAEIAQSITPSAVAYNFIESILCRDYERMLSYVCYEYNTYFGDNHPGISVITTHFG